MRNQLLRLYQTFGLIFLTSLLIIGLFVSIVSHLRMNETTANPFMIFAIVNHIWIMIALVILSIIFGFFWSIVLFSEVQKKEQLSSEAKKAILNLLSKDERCVLESLLKSSGNASQSQLAVATLFHKVKIFRTLQKLRQKDIVRIESNKRQRMVKLNEQYMRLLRMPNEQSAVTD